MEGSLSAHSHCMLYKEIFRHNDQKIERSIQRNTTSLQSVMQPWKADMSRANVLRSCGYFYSSQPVLLTKGQQTAMCQELPEICQTLKATKCLIFEI
jgi:hypothetical protein